MANEELTRLVTLAAGFKNAVEASPLANDPVVAEKIQNSITAPEMEKLQEIMSDLAGESLNLAFGGEPSESFLKKNLEVADLMTAFMLRAIPADKLAPLVPAELKNAKDAEALKKAGAPALASLAQPK